MQHTYFSFLTTDTFIQTNDIGCSKNVKISTMTLISMKVANGAFKCLYNRHYFRGIKPFMT